MFDIDNNAFFRSVSPKPYRATYRLLLHILFGASTYTLRYFQVSEIKNAFIINIQALYKKLEYANSLNFDFIYLLNILISLMNHMNNFI